jgi:hypothetical protein
MKRDDSKQAGKEYASIPTPWPFASFPDNADPRYGSFYDNLSAEELARRQGVKPVEDISKLYGNGDPADWEGFDEALEQWRAQGRS